jgi:hypothetical protein
MIFCNPCAKAKGYTKAHKKEWLRCDVCKSLDFCSNVEARTNTVLHRGPEVRFVVTKGKDNRFSFYCTYKGETLLIRDCRLGKCKYCVSRTKHDKEYHIICNAYTPS